ncbi:hypothetical protein FBU30_003655 [Linnemannia zychae]|nr:hypothetical protein FBU30_003655 [Linnemannia zychae]
MTQDEPITTNTKKDDIVAVSNTTSIPSPTVNIAVHGNAFPFDRASQHESQKLKRQQDAPPKRPVNPRHLDEFVARDNKYAFDLGIKRPVSWASSQRQQQPSVVPREKEKDITDNETATSPEIPISSSLPKKSPTKRLKEPLSIRPKSLSNFLADGLRLYISNIKNPDQIPGTDWFSRVYAMGLLPVLVVSMAIVQGGIGLLVILINYTKVGARLYKKFFEDEIALIDESDYINPDGTDHAIRQLADRTTRTTTHFSYHIANLLLIMSSMAYQRNEKLVAEASKILLNVTTQKQRDQAAELLEQSEKEIDEKAIKEFGMRFVGISELKTLGGPFAGLFYNDDSIVLVFKGTSVLAFNEYLIDVTIQRVDASEYLYGEVHTGFYECLFPDAKPEMYDNQTYDRTNPFNTIMETIFEIAKASKEKTGKPVNLWLTGHSLGGALAALVMARLQMPIMDYDPLMQNDDEDEYDEHGHHLPRQCMDSTATVCYVSGTNDVEGGTIKKTVLAEMLARYSDDHELLVLRDCYSIASPKIGDSVFANEFAKYQYEYCQASPYKSIYWRIVANEDIVPRLPPAGNVDPQTPNHKRFPPACLKCFKTPQEWLKEEQEEDQQQGVKPDSHVVKERPPKHLHSLLDYQHVGQLIRVFYAKRVPIVKPSAFEANLSKGVLRKGVKVQELLEKLRNVAEVWKAQSLATKNEYLKTHPEGVSELTPLIDYKSTTDTVDATTTLTIAQERAKAAQQITDDVAKAQEIYEIDENSRLRQPGVLETFLLKIPSLLSHAPAAYQRDIIQGRFYFMSFPGTLFEERLTEWLKDEQQQKKQVETNVEDDVKALEMKKEDSGHFSEGHEDRVENGNNAVVGHLVDI